MWKVIGGILGYYLFNIWGLVLGMVIGTVVDISRSSLKIRMSKAPIAQQQKVFFQTLFLLMGRLAKSDGHVSPEEIQLASQVMDKMTLDRQSRKEAIELFNQGKASSFNLVAVLTSFQSAVGIRTTLTRTLIELLLMLAYADGEFSVEEKTLMSQICAHLGIGVSEFAKIHLQIKQQYQFRQHRKNADSELSNKDLLKAAYGTIAVSDDMTDAQIKKAYRKLMSENHPDKLIARGLPEEMITLAKERTQEIQASYELIKKARKK